MSWIHIDDAINLIDFCLHDVELRGAVNAVAPQAVTQRAFQEQLARLWHRPLWLKIPGSVLRLALGEMAQLLVDGQRVIPKRATAAGFHFQYPNLDAVLRDLLAPAAMANRR